jgi:radical SAM superfamily enzyme YgiQ (UPF0313 family)
MKLLLISLQSNAYITGLKYVAANAKSNGHDVRILFLPGYLEEELSYVIEDFIRNYSPDLIGISLMSIEFYPAKNFTRLLKKRFEIPVIWGGVHVIIKPEECIKYADYVCTGDGEYAVVSLLEHLRINGKNVPPEIPGVWANINGEIIKNPVAHPEMNLDNFPFQEYLPDYFYAFHKNDIHNFAENQGLFRRYALYGGICHMAITTRGCPYKCSYCGNSAFIKVYGRKVRERTVGNVITELLKVKKNPYVLYINFQDDCFFTHNREWIKEFCELYKKRIGLPFVARVIPTMMDRDKFLMLRDAGLSWIVMGIQTGCDRINFDIYDRKIRFTTVKKAADIISETRAAPFYEMIVDNPYETDEETMETINGMSELKKPYAISLAHLTYFPGTPLAERAVKDKIATADAYLYQYILKIDDNYFNKLLGITPYIPGILIKCLNKPGAAKRKFHVFLLNILYFIAKRTVEPGVFLFIVTRSFDYRLNWTIRTVIGNWRPTLARLVSSYLGKGDLEYDRRLTLAKKNIPELFEKTD